MQKLQFECCARTRCVPRREAFKDACVCVTRLVWLLWRNAADAVLTRARYGTQCCNYAVAAGEVVCRAFYGREKRKQKVLKATLHL